MKLKITLFVLSILMIIIGYLLVGSYNIFGVCIGDIVKDVSSTSYGEDLCRLSFGRLGWALQGFGVYLFPVSFFLLFATKRVVSNWVKYAKWFTPVLFILFLAYEQDMFMPSIVTIRVWLSTVFLILSISIILFSNLQKYKRK